MVNDLNAGGWFDLAFGDATQVFTGTTVNIASTVIPVPAAVWLFGSGLLGLVGVAAVVLCPLLSALSRLDVSTDREDPLFAPLKQPGS